MMPALNLRAARAADIRALYGHDLPFTARAWVAEEDDKIIGLMGYYLPNGPPIVFSKLLPEIRRYKKTILREARRMMSELPSSMFCCADKNEESAQRFLTHLGWVHVATAPEGEVYIWLKQ